MACQRSDIQSVLHFRILSSCIFCSTYTHCGKQASTQWCMITASIDDKDATELLHRLIELQLEDFHLQFHVLSFTKPHTRSHYKGAKE